MTNISHPELIPMELVRKTMLVYPSTGKVPHYTLCARYMRELGIVPTLKRVEGSHQAHAHVTPEEAARMVERFRTKHRRQFKAKA